jgi:hypothetical protein
VKTFSISIDIQAPPATAAAVMTGIERWHEWTSTITSIRRLDDGPLRVGSRAAVRQPRLPPATWTVTGIEPGRGFTWTTKSPGVTILARHFAEPAPGGCRATLSLEFSGPLGGLVARLTRGLNQRYLKIEAEGLKRRSEAGPASR